MMHPGPASPTPRAARRSQPREAGFALIIVLWTMVLLALLVAHLEQIGRNEAQLALNLRRAASLQAQADGAIAVAAFHLLDHSAAGWAGNGQPHVLDVEDDGFTRKIVVRISDEAGKIDLNTAPEPLLQALVTVLGTDPAEAAEIATNLIAWRFPAGSGQAANLAAAPYKTAGLSYGPPNAPYESVDELQLVLGVSPSLAARLTPHLTIFHQGSPDPRLADAVVRRSVVTAGILVQRGGSQGGNVLKIVLVTATAYGDAGSAYTREATLSVGQLKDGWMHILAWNAP